MIVYEPTTPFIDTVYALPKQLSAGDIVYRDAYVGRSAYTPAYCFEVLSIVDDGKCYTVTVRYDYGGLDVWTWERWNIGHEVVVGGDKVLRANTEAGTVKKTWAGWVWQEGR